MPSDPLEKIVFAVLPKDTVCDGTKGQHGATKHLDFYIPSAGVYVEVTAKLTGRKFKQLSRADNIIYIQGRAACEFFAKHFKSEEI